MTEFKPVRISRQIVADLNSVHPAMVACRNCKFKAECKRLWEDVHTTSSSYCGEFRMK